MATPQDLLVIADKLPPGLNTADRPTDIGVDETPDSYGFDLTVDGAIAKGTIPTSTTARVQKTVTLTEGALSVPYLWEYGRLWNITNRTASTASNTLIYGAPFYDDIYVPQRNGKLFFSEDANPILAIVPFGGDSMAVVKTSGTYIISNIADTRALFQRTGLIQELNAAAANRVLELDGVLYVSNADGLISWSRGQTTELFRKVRNDLTNFSSVALLADYERHWIKGGSAFIYDVPTEKLFYWSGSSFRFTTRQHHLPDYAPMSCERIWWVVEQTDEEGGWIEYQTRLDDAQWQDEEQVTVPFEQETETLVASEMSEPRTASRFQIRVTDMASNLRLKRIMMDQSSFNMNDYRAPGI